MRRNHLIAAAVICLVLIVYATLAKLAGRPALMGHAEAYWVVVIERFSAYGLLGFLLSFLLPGRVKLACAFVVAVAVGLEVLQAVMPDRDTIHRCAAKGRRRHRRRPSGPDHPGFPAEAAVLRRPPAPRELTPLRVASSADWSKEPRTSGDGHRAAP